METDVPPEKSKEHERLEAVQNAADAVLAELTPLKSISDSGALRDFLKDLVSRNEVRYISLLHLD